MSTPARQQYLGIKAQHQDALLAYQIGDFFEFFDDDARTVARELQIALTGRSYGPAEHVPLAGVPIHAIDTYLTRLVARGYKVAVCEQTSPPGRGLVRREVTRILTPGTVVEPGMLPTARDNYLVAVAFGRRDPTTGQPRSVGLAAVDASTGAFTCVQWSGAALPDALQAELRRLAPAETLAPERLAQPPTFAPPATSRQSAGRLLNTAVASATPANAAAPNTPPEAPPTLPQSVPLPDGDATPTNTLPLPVGEGNAQAAGQARVGAGLSWLDPFPVTLRPDHDFDAESAYTLLCRQFGAPTLAAFGCEGLPQAIGAAGAILCYLERMNPALLPMLTGLRTYTTDDFVAIDGGAWRALEVVEAAHAPAVGVSHLSHTRRPVGANGGGGGGASGAANRPTTLLATLDATRTAMGARLLRRTLTQPLRDRLAIEARLDAVADLHDNGVARERLGATLDGLGDLERLTARVAQGIAVPRELYALAAGLARVPLAREALHGARAAALVGLRDALDPCDEAREFILRAVADPLAGTGRTLQPGYHAELDRLVESVSEARQWIATLEGVERERTGIRSLKVGFNKVFGYYIEVSRPNVPRVPADYQRRQTLSTGERYVTADLKEREALVLSAEEQITALERTLYGEALRELAGYQSRLRTTVAALAQLDVWLGLAEVARVRRFVRPELTDGTEMEIVGGRHPIVEATLDGAEFIPNETRLAALGDPDAGARIMLLTGPNMAGKSTYLRQVSSITLLAQIGSFVPATSARIGLVDRIFTRVGAEDDLARGLSTFMLEMVETAYILRHATAHSLIVLDEVGRGTSVGDGVAIACAVVEYLHDQVGARTLFATHYDELARLAARLPRLRVYRMDVAERDGQAIFLRRVVPGVSERSYGVQVARMAGLPPSVTARADALLAHATSVAAVAAGASADASAGASAGAPTDANGAHADTGRAPGGVYARAGANHVGDAGSGPDDDAAPGAALRQRARRIAEGLAPYTPTAHDLPAPRDAAAHDGVTHDGVTHDGAARDNAARDNAARDNAARDNAARDNAARDNAARDETARDETARDETARDGNSAPLALNDAGRDDATLASPTTDQSVQPKNESLAIEIANRAPLDATALQAGEIADLATLAVALASLNIAATTPLDALNLLFALQQRALAILQADNAGQTPLS